MVIGVSGLWPTPMSTARGDRRPADGAVLDRIYRESDGQLALPNLAAPVAMGNIPSRPLRLETSSADPKPSGLAPC